MAAVERKRRPSSNVREAYRMYQEDQDLDELMQAGKQTISVGDELKRSCRAKRAVRRGPHDGRFAEGAVSAVVGECDAAVAAGQYDPYEEAPGYEEAGDYRYRGRYRTNGYNVPNHVTGRYYRNKGGYSRLSDYLSRKYRNGGGYGWGGCPSGACPSGACPPRGGSGGYSSYGSPMGYYPRASSLGSYNYRNGYRRLSI